MLAALQAIRFPLFKGNPRPACACLCSRKRSCLELDLPGSVWDVKCSGCFLMGWVQRRKSVFTESFHACLGAPGGVYLCQREPVNSLWLAQLLQASPQHMAEPSSSPSVLYLWMGDIQDLLVPERGARRQVKSVLAFLPS